jgi:hypothetical protein
MASKLTGIAWSAERKSRIDAYGSSLAIRLYEIETPFALIMS